jgi:hypothetical protein
MLKLFDGLVWVVVGALVAWAIFNTWQVVRHRTEILDQLESFQKKGPRFTAENGNELCRDIQELQRLAGLEVRECAFGDHPQP